ncbi:MBL fold metallo-hydrolase [Kitasatospora sp. NPDC049285]|uniref:MBL fold metallo-hydrolase n=1 Tax=Kitasatospora sp. NPDC049285 TaxID=3157096 RepID=UPI0034129F27
MSRPVSWLFRAGELAAEAGLALRDAKHAYRTLPHDTWQRMRTDAFGADPSGYRWHRVQNSPHFVDGAFRNPVPTRRLVYAHTPMTLLRSKMAIDHTRRAPAAAVPLHRLLPVELATPPASGLRLTWLGHSTVLAELDGVRVLFDPVWSERCSPFDWIGPKRLHPVPLPLTELGPVDVVVISHDHYDHLDMDTVRTLAAGDAVFAVPLGIGAHLEHWGVPPRLIVELDWWESAEIDGLRLTATPARHYCSRGPRPSSKFLWASWAVAGKRHRVFHSGDSGYFPGFADIGRRLGPFDATMLQVGAYSEQWPEVHLTPEEAVQAHRDLRGDLMLPIHWCTFDLAPHPWEEPAERVVAAAQAAGTNLALPRPGKPFEPADPPALKLWWRAVATMPSGAGLLVPDGLTPLPAGVPDTPAALTGPNRPDAPLAGPSARPQAPLAAPGAEGELPLV